MPPSLTEDEIDDLLYLARTGDNDELSTLIAQLAEREKCPSSEILAAARDEGKSTCLHMACGNGHLETVNLLLGSFTSPSPASTDPSLKTFLDAQNEYGNTGLHWAALGGYLALVKRLVEAGASPAIANDRNYLPLDLAAQKEHGEVLDFFLAESGGLEEANADAGGVAAAAEGIEVDGDDDPADGKDDAADARAERMR